MCHFDRSASFNTPLLKGDVHLNCPEEFVEPTNERLSIPGGVEPEELLLTFASTLPVVTVARPVTFFYAALVMIRLDYLSCVLTIISTVLVGKKVWHGWIVAAVNSAVICFIGIRTAQFGFVPANLLCIGLYANNLSRRWPKDAGSSSVETVRL